MIEQILRIIGWSIGVLTGLLVLLGLGLYGVYHGFLYKGRGRHPIHYSSPLGNRNKEREQGEEREREDWEREVLNLPGIVLAERIAQGYYTSLQVTNVFIRQIEKVNVHMNAICERRYELALREAKFCDECDIRGLYPSSGLANDAVETMSPNGRETQHWNKRRPIYWGLPCTVKECISLKGMPNTSGLVSRKGCCSEADAPAVYAMRAHGLIPIANTNLSELCMWYESSNNVYGRTNNAYHTGRIVGGSSGGEAALISAAGPPVGIGSDIGGSIRMPAHFNGIWGHKPSPGMIAAVGQYPYSATPLLSTGPLTRYALDLWSMFTLMVGDDNELEGADAILQEFAPEVRQRYCYRENQTKEWRQLHQMTLCEAASKRLLEISPENDSPNEDDYNQWNGVLQTLNGGTRQDLSPLIPIFRSRLRIFTLRNIQGILPALSSKVQTVILDGIHGLVQSLQNIIRPSLDPQELELPELTESFDIWSAMMTDNDSPTFRSLMEDEQKIDNIIVELLKALFGGSKYTVPAIGLAAIEDIPENLTPERVKRLRKLGSEIRSRIASQLGSSGILITPVHPTVAPPHNVPLGRIHNVVLTAFFNALHVPVTVVPLGLDKNGVPFGAQIVGAPGEDALTIAVATLLEQYCGRFADETHRQLAYATASVVPESQQQRVGWIPPTLSGAL